MGISRGERNIQWIEQHCYVPEGRFVGRPIELIDVHKRLILDLYNSPTRMLIFSVGRKNAKTTIAACLLLLHLAGPEHKVNSQLYSDAQSRDQASILFSLAAKIVRMSPDLNQFIVVRDTAKQLYCPELGTLYRALSAEASTSFGLSPALAIHDELGQVRGPRSELFEAIETACAAQEQPLSIVISTQAPTDNDLLSILIDDAKTKANPEVKLHLYTADMDIDPFSETAIRQANPAFDKFMNKTEVLAQAESARRMPSREASYRNLILNQRVEAKEPFVTKSVWEANGDYPEPMDGRDVYGGLDLSSVSDLTALELASWRDGKWDIESTFWLPSEGLAEKSRSDRVPYDIWESQGFLNTCPGSSVEYEFVAHYLRDIFDRCNVKAIAFDRWGMRHLKPWLEKAGFSDDELARFMDFGQGFQSMSPALRDLESLLLNKNLRHGNHPVLAMCAANARIQTDPAGGRKFTKSKSTGRIDGMVALAMAVGSMPENVEEDGFVVGDLHIL